MEYLVLFGFLLLLTVPLIILFYSESSSAAAQVRAQQTHALGQQIVDRAESIYYLGAPSRTEMRLSFPDGIKNATLRNKELVFVVQAIEGTSEVVIPSKINLTGSLSVSQGVHTITFLHTGANVRLNST